MKNFYKLKRGDIVKNKGSGESYIVDGNYGNKIILIKTILVMNPSEWEKVPREDLIPKPLDPNLIPEEKFEELVVTTTTPKKTTQTVFEWGITEEELLGDTPVHFGEGEHHTRKTLAKPLPEIKEPYKPIEYFDPEGVYHNSDPDEEAKYQ